MAERQLLKRCQGAGRRSRLITWPGNKYEFHSFGGAFTSDRVMPAMTAISYHRGSCTAAYSVVSSHGSHGPNSLTVTLTRVRVHCLYMCHDLKAIVYRTWSAEAAQQD